MAFVRFGSLDTHGYDSDVYVYNSVFGGLECCGCLLGTELPQTAWFRCDTPEQMARHVQEHVNAGHRVPPFVIPTLIEGASLPDPVLAKMMVRAIEGGGKLVTYDADVPENLRMSADELRELEAESRRVEGVDGQ